MAAFLLGIILAFLMAPSMAQEIATGMEEASSPSHSSPPKERQVRELVQKSCIAGATGAWAETLKNLVTDPYEFMAHTSPDVTKRFLEDCDKHVECKVRLYFEAHGHSPSGRELEKLQKPMGFKTLDVLQRNANARMNSSYEQNLRFRQTIENKKWVSGKTYQPSVALDVKQENQSFWINLAERMKEIGWKAMTDDQAFCYYVAQILDPAAAAGLIAKSPKIAKFVGKLVSADAKVASRVELTSAEIDKIKLRTTPAQAETLDRTLAKMRAGETVSVAEAEESAKILNDAGIRGVFAFHRTTPEGIQKIAEAGEMIGKGVQGSRVYAFPANPGASASRAAGKAVGDEVVMFQGQAASLFNDIPLRGAASALGRYHSHIVSPIGRLVIDEYEKVGSTLIIKRAHMITSTSDQLSLVRARTLDVASVVSPVGTTGFVTYYTFSEPSDGSSN